MSLEPDTFETIIPSRFLTFTFPNPSLHNHHLHTHLLRVAVLDSPPQPFTNPPKVVTMLVPPNRESDWTFSTQPGHLQLLTSFPHISRLILIGNNPISAHPTTYNRPLRIGDDDPVWKLEENLTPLVFALLPKSAFSGRALPDIRFSTYEDDVIRSVIVERCFGSCVGEFLVEDVELEDSSESDKCNREFRRRLRFKRMPNLIQTQIRIVPNTSENESDRLDCVGLEGVEFRVDVGVLVHSYLTPMVAGLSLIASHLDERIGNGIRPKALCLGVGGGALLGFLNTQLGFEVMVVEADEAVLRVARKYFGLEDGEYIRTRIGDGIELLEKLALREKKRNDDSLYACNAENCGGLNDLDVFDAKFDVIMVDLDSSDARLDTRAPSSEFVRKAVLLAARLVLCELGILVINVIPQSRSFYEKLIHECKEVFEELYEINVGNGDNFVLIASASPIGTASDSKNYFFKKLKLVISGAYMDSIRKI